MATVAVGEGDVVLAARIMGVVGGVLILASAVAESTTVAGRLSVAASCALAISAGLAWRHHRDHPADDELPWWGPRTKWFIIVPVAVMALYMGAAFFADG